MGVTRPDPVAVAGRWYEAWLRRGGTSQTAAEQQRSEVREHATARWSAALAWTTVVRGQRAVVMGVGRIEWRPIELEGSVVRIEQSAISPGTERAQWLRLPSARPSFPYVPGYSAVGRVLGPHGEPTDRRVALLRTGHQSIAALPRRPLDVPATVSDAAASLVYLGAIAAYGIDVAGEVSGRRVAVVGQGMIGALTTRLAASLGPAELIAVAASDRRRYEALSNGADRFVVADETRPDVEADLVIDASGARPALAWATAAAVDGGTVVVLGSVRGEQPLPLGEIARRSIDLRGAHISNAVARARAGHGRSIEELAARYLDAVATEQVNVDDLVGLAFHPHELHLAYRGLARRDIDGARLDWSQVTADARARRLAPFVRPPRRPAPAQGRDRPSPTGATDADVRVAVIGCGDIGMADARAAATATGVRLVTCHDQVLSAAQRAASSLGCVATDDLDRALDPDHVDVAIVATPHDDHEPTALAAIDRGLHVVVEKPLAHDLPSARRIIDAADRKGVGVSVAFPYRYLAQVGVAAQLVRDGAIGELAGAEIAFHADKPDAYWYGGFSGRSTSDWRMRVERAGGGVIIMNMTHYLDLLMHITGRRIVSASAAGRASRVDGIEEMVSATLVLDGGAVVAMTASGVTVGGGTNRFQLVGDDGTVRLEPDPSVFTRRAVSGFPTGEWAPIGAESTEAAARRRLVEEVGRAIRTGTALPVPASDALAVQAVVDACYRSMETGSAVEVTA